jgi:3-oxoadipate enol-lactonase
VRVQTARGSISYVETGKGPVILFLHAFPLNASMWLPQTESFSNQFRVIAPDLPGFGESTPVSPWTIEDACADLNEFLTKLNVEDCTLVGLSMGGYIGLPLASRYPDRVRRLVLADTRARADNEAERNARTDMIAAIQQDSAALSERMLPRLLRPNADPNVTRTVKAIIGRTNLQAAIYALEAMRERSDASLALQQLVCPVLVIVGEDDVVTRVEESRAMAKVAAHGTFIEVPAAGHLSNLENPLRFNEALRSFLVA